MTRGHNHAVYRHMRRFFLIITAFLGVVLTPLFSQEPPQEQQQDQAKAADIAKPLVDLDILRLQLAPLTKEELAEEVDSWLALVKSKAQAITDLEISQLENNGGAEAAKANLVNLRDEKGKIMNRAEIVLAAFELKGGDPSTHRKYLEAVKGVEPALTDVVTRYQLISKWLQSKEGGFALLTSAIKFFAVLLLFWIFSIIASKVVQRVLAKKNAISALQENFINKMSKRLVLVIGFIVALGTIGINVGAALALIGGGAFILAFALQDSLSNFASGLMLLLYRPFDVGDAVEIGGTSGSVDSVSLVSTTIRTFDNKKVLIPNNKVWGETITNITGMPNRRVDMIFGIGYDDDIEKAQAILERIVEEHELTLEIPEPTTKLHELGDSSVNFICRPWAKTSDHWTVYWDITKRVKIEFDAAGISIPFPQRDVHVYNADK